MLEVSRHTRLNGTNTSLTLFPSATWSRPRHPRETRKTSYCSQNSNLQFIERDCTESTSDWTVNRNALPPRQVHLEMGAYAVQQNRRLQDLVPSFPNPLHLVLWARAATGSSSIFELTREVREKWERRENTKMGIAGTRFFVSVAMWFISLRNLNIISPLMKLVCLKNICVILYLFIFVLSSLLSLFMLLILLFIWLTTTAATKKILLNNLPHVRESGIRNPANFCCWDPESRGLESGIHNGLNPESTMVWNPESTMVWNLESTMVWIWNPLWYGIRNPESRKLESGIQRPWSGIQDLHGFSYMGRNNYVKVRSPWKVCQSFPRSLASICKLTLLECCKLNIKLEQIKIIISISISIISSISISIISILKNQ